MILKTFFNWTSEDFTYPYGGEPQTFRSGETRMMEGGMADFFARHLADLQMNKLNISFANRDQHKQFVDKCLTAQTEPMSAITAKDSLINQDIPETIEAPVQMKRRGPKSKTKVVTEEKFEGVE